MAKKILITALLVVAGALIGFVLGAILGFYIGRGLDLLGDNDAFKWRALYGAISGAVAGSIAGAGTGGLGIRSRLGLEWIPIYGIGIPLGFWIQSGLIELDLGLIAGIGALASWFVVLLIRLLFGKWLSRGSFEKNIVIVYVLIAVLVVFAAPLALQIIASIFYF